MINTLPLSGGPWGDFQSLPFVSAPGGGSPAAGGTHSGAVPSLNLSGGPWGFITPFPFTALPAAGGVEPALPGSLPAAVLLLLRYRPAAARAGAADFWVALEQWFRSDADLPARFPGGMIEGAPQPDQPIPFLRVDEGDLKDPLSPDDWELEARFSVYARTADTARELGAALAARVDDLTTRPAMAFDGWYEAGHRAVRVSRPVRVGWGADMTSVWRYDIAFRFFVVRSGTAGAWEP